MNTDSTGNTSTAATATSLITLTTTSRALLLQLTHLYLRTPAKLFRPPRWDYLTPSRILLEPELRNKPWKFLTHSSIALLYKSVKLKGWGWVGEQMGPPLIANGVVGGVLYGVYLYSINNYANKRIHEQQLELKKAQESGIIEQWLNKMVWTGVTTWDTFKSGFFAGAISSFIASPLDALYSRNSYSELINGKGKDGMISYAWKKLGDVGIMGIFAGFWLNLIKESVGFGCYFTTFETVKNHGYFLAKGIIDGIEEISDSTRQLMGLPIAEHNHMAVTKGERVLRLSFVLLAGASAAFTLVGIQYPINKIQMIHLARLEALDLFNEATKSQTRRWFQRYYHSYKQTWEIILERKIASGEPWGRFMYKGFGKFTVANIPATSIGLLIFEIGREKLSQELEEEWLKP
ncbi:hypothetical protein DAMA08_034190 [Martiniozyma asiatica (nom. inval.)]|nr:hypothetical protein DAMA08_034190 [Martiniozyma asiatica]